jgi:hypothetical protein
MNVEKHTPMGMLLSVVLIAVAFALGQMLYEKGLKNLID